MKKILILTLLVALSFMLASCTPSVEEVPLQCSEAELVSGDKCIPNPNYVDPASLCRGVNFDYDEDSLTYNLIWSDEFDGDTLDSEKWRYEVNGGGGGNNEAQYYTSDNAEVGDGTLKIIAKKEEYLGRSYTSSRITTASSFTFTYGRVEVRAKHPAGLGTWSAAWMMPKVSTYGGWPNSGEIDITEFVGYDSGRSHSTIHTELYNHKRHTQKGGSKVVDDLTTEFHTFTVEWLPDKMVFSVDDLVVFTYAPGRYQSCPHANQWPFDKDFFIILNLAIGGDWGGAQGIDEDAFPTIYEIDYVRVYQAEELEDIQMTEDPS